MRIVFYFLMLPCFLFGQENEAIQWSEKETENFNFKDLAAFNNEYYLIKNQNTGAAIQSPSKTRIYKYNSALKLVAENKFIAKVGSKKVIAFKFLKGDQKMYLISKQTSGGIFNLIINELNNDLSYAAEPTAFLKMKATNSNFSTGLFIEQSPNNAYTVICAYQKSKTKGISMYKFSILDKDMKTLKEDFIEIPNAARNGVLKEIAISNQGNISGVSFGKGKKKRSLVHVWKYNYSVNKSSVTEIKQIDDKYLIDIELAVRNEEILISGGYSLKPKNNNYPAIRGVCFVVSNFSDQAPLKLKYIPLSLETLIISHPKTIQKTALNKGKIKEFIGFDLGESALWKDDYIIINGERDFTSGDLGSSSKNTGCGMVICLNRAGDIIWEVPVIKKHQNNSFNKIQGHSVLLTHEKVHIIFNNFHGDVNGVKPLFPISEATLLTTVTEDGSKNTIKLFQKSVRSVMTNPSRILQIDEHQALMYCTGFAPSRLGLLDLNKID